MGRKIISLLTVVLVVTLLAQPLIANATNTTRNRDELLLNMSGSGMETYNYNSTKKLFDSRDVYAQNFYEAINDSTYICTLQLDRSSGLTSEDGIGDSKVKIPSTKNLEGDLSWVYVLSVKEDGSNQKADILLINDSELYIHRNAQDTTSETGWTPVSREEDLRAYIGSFMFSGIFMHTVINDADTDGRNNLLNFVTNEDYASWNYLRMSNGYGDFSISPIKDSVEGLVLFEYNYDKTSLKIYNEVQSDLVNTSLDTVIDSYLPSYQRDFEINNLENGLDRLRRRILVSGITPDESNRININNIITEYKTSKDPYVTIVGTLVMEYYKSLTPALEFNSELLNTAVDLMFGGEDENARPYSYEFNGVTYQLDEFSISNPSKSPLSEMYEGDELNKLSLDIMVLYGVLRENASLKGVVFDIKDLDGNSAPIMGIVNKSDQSEYKKVRFNSTSTLTEAVEKARGLDIDVSDNYLYQVDSLSSYLIAEMSGAKMIPQSNSADYDKSNLAHLEVNENVQGVLSSLNGKVVTLPSSFRLMDFDRVVEVSNTYEAYRAYYELQKLMLIVETTFTEEYSLVDLQGETISIAYDNWKSMNEVVDYSSIVDQDISDLVTASVNVYKALTALGVEEDDMTSKLKYVYGIGKKFNNTYVSKKVSKHDYNSNSETEPFSAFFNLEQLSLSDDLLKGIAISSTYVPLETNVYEPLSMKYVDDIDFVNDFHLKYGFLRKAVYIEDNPSSVTDTYLTGVYSGTRVATLRDLVNCDLEITLRVDGNIYDKESIDDRMEGLVTKVSFDNMKEETFTDKDIESIVKDAKNVVAVVKEDGVVTLVNRSVAKAIVELNPITEGYKKSVENILRSVVVTAQASVNSFLYDIDEVVKTPPFNKYNKEIRDSIWEYGYEAETADKATLKYLYGMLSVSNYVFYNGTELLDSLENDDSVDRKWGVLSAIYRDKSLFDYLYGHFYLSDTVLLESSSKLANLEGSGYKGEHALINYAYLKNLRDEIKKSSELQVNLDQPLFTDIYGNILLESGLVVVPAATNATLSREGTYSPFSVGMAKTYGNTYRIPTKEYNMQYSNYFSEGQSGEEYYLVDKAINGVSIDFTNYPYASSEIVRLTYELYENVYLDKSIILEGRVNQIVEVLRGSEIQNIDLVAEGIKDDSKMTGVVVSMASKLEGIMESFLFSEEGNPLLALPSVFSSESYYFYTSILLRLVFVMFMLVASIMVYREIVDTTISWMTLVRFFSMLLLIVVSVTVVPWLVTTTAYNVNKVVLSEEAIDIVMNYSEKYLEEKEVGITRVNDFSTDNVFRLKVGYANSYLMDDLSAIFATDIIGRRRDNYERSIEDNAFVNLAGVSKESDGLYFDVLDMLNDSSVDYNVATRELVAVNVGKSSVGNVLPYYLFLDILTDSVNSYNRASLTSNFSTDVMRNGSIKSKGLVKDYFESEQFVDSKDILRLSQFYTNNLQSLNSTIFNEVNRDLVRESPWFYDTNDAEEVESIRSEMDRAVKMFVINRSDVLGEVTDETFLEAMALTLSLEYNRIVKNEFGRYIEISNLETKDLMLLSTFSRDTIMSNSIYNYPRMVYEYVGGGGILLAVILTLIYFVISVAKPVIVGLIVCISILSVLKGMYNRNTKNIVSGFLSTISLAVFANVGYSLILKLLMFLGNTEISSIILLLIQIVVQLAYSALLVKLIVDLVRSKEEIGYNSYVNTISSFNGRIAEFRHEGSIKSLLKKPKFDDTDYLEQMHERDNKREGAE